MFSYVNRKNRLEVSDFWQPVTFFLSLQDIAGRRKEAGRKLGLEVDPKGGAV